MCCGRFAVVGVVVRRCRRKVVVLAVQLIADLFNTLMLLAQSRRRYKCKVRQ
jgi:hypothetical protein